MPAFSRLRVAILLSLVGGGLVGLTLAQPKPETPETIAARESLQKLNAVIGSWRGTGQPRRGSNRGAWQESAEFIWDFAGDVPAINYVVKTGKLAQQATLRYDTDAKNYVLKLTKPDATEETLTGTWEMDQLVFTSSGTGEQQRLTLTLLNEKRTLVLFESRNSPTATFNRVAEVGYTREGTRLALPGGGQPECIVTGGAASIPVTYKGKTYYVCCTGCKQAFEDDPEGIIAEAAERAKKAREQSAQ